jgi:hypothetical protein
MQNTNCRQRLGAVLRLLGILVTTPALFFLFVFLFLNGIVVRGKGFSYPLIDPYHLPEAAICIPFVVLGIGLFLWGGKKGKPQEARSDATPDNHAPPSNTL